jgi:hypothetical protein
VVERRQAVGFSSIKCYSVSTHVCCDGNVNCLRSAYLRSIKRRAKDVSRGGNIVLENECALRVKGRGCFDACVGCCGEDMMNGVPVLRGPESGENGVC